MQNKEEKQELDKRIGKRFKELIRSRGLTQQQIADEVHLSKQSISNICSGHQDITPNVWRFADLLGVSTDYLLCRSDYKTRDEEFKELVHTHGEKSNRAHNIKNLIEKILEEKGVTCEKSVKGIDGEPDFSLEDAAAPQSVAVSFSIKESSESVQSIMNSSDYDLLIEDINEYINFRILRLLRTSLGTVSFKDEATPISYNKISEMGFSLSEFLRESWKA